MCRDPKRDPHKPVEARRDSTIIVPMGPLMVADYPEAAFNAAAAGAHADDDAVADALVSLPAVQAALARRMTRAAIDRSEIEPAQVSACLSRR